MHNNVYVSRSVITAPYYLKKNKKFTVKNNFACVKVSRVRKDNLLKCQHFDLLWNCGNCGIYSK